MGMVRICTFHRSLMSDVDDRCDEVSLVGVLSLLLLMLMGHGNTRHRGGLKQTRNVDGDETRRFNQNSTSIYSELKILRNQDHFDQIIWDKFNLR